MKLYGIVLVLAASLSYASDPDDGDISVITGGSDATSAATSGAEAAAMATMTGGDVVYDSSSLALAQSLGDVDLGVAAKCVVTEQVGVIIFQRQWTEYDEWCLAEILDAQGKHSQAAIMRCSDKSTRKTFGKNCELLLIVTPVYFPVVAATPNQAVEQHVEEAVEFHAEQREEYESLENRLDKIEAANRAGARASRERKARAQFTLEQIQGKDNDPEDE